MDQAGNYALFIDQLIDGVKLEFKQIFLYIFARLIGIFIELLAQCELNISYFPDI